MLRTDTLFLGERICDLEACIELYDLDADYDKALDDLNEREIMRIANKARRLAKRDGIL